MDEVKEEGKDGEAGEERMRENSGEKLREKVIEEE